MAYGDTYTSQPGSEGDGADKTVSYTFAPTTAQGQPYLGDYAKEQRLFLEDAERAAAAGVTGVDKIEYAEALRNYESRSDVELFLNRRAREYATDFNAQDFARQAAQEANMLQSSTLGSTTVVKGDDYVDVAGGPDPDGAGPATTSPDGTDDAVIAPDRT